MAADSTDPAAAALALEDFGEPAFVAVSASFGQVLTGGNGVFPVWLGSNGRSFTSSNRTMY